MAVLAAIAGAPAIGAADGPRTCLVFGQTDPYWENELIGWLEVLRTVLGLGTGSGGELAGLVQEAELKVREFILAADGARIPPGLGETELWTGVLAVDSARRVLALEAGVVAPETADKLDLTLLAVREALMAEVKP